MIETEQQPVLGGRYKIIEYLGSGRATEVYRAHDTLLDREVAVKSLREEYATDPDSVKKFRRWARAAASLSHPNIVQVYELGRSDSGSPFVAMEYAKGVTLEQRLRHFGVLEPIAAARIAAQIASALQAAHERNIVHGNLEPRKVLLTESVGVKVTDFGSTRNSPFGNEDNEGNDPSGDPHSLGAMLYEMLTGATPSSTENVDGSQPRPPAELDARIPEEISDLTMRLISNSPEERPRDNETLLREIEEAVESYHSPRFKSENSRTYQTGTRLPPIFASRAGSLLSGLTGEGKRTARSKTGSRKRLRRRRRRDLAIVSLAVVLIASVWALYDNGLNLTYPEAPSQASVASEPQAQTGGDAAQAQTAPDQVLVHTAGAENISDNSTYLDIPAANGNPDARISITQNWNPGGGSGTYNDHPVGVWYDASREQWAIFNQDRAAMPVGTSFNVLVWNGPVKKG